MAKSMWHRGAIRLNRRNGGEEVVAGVEGVLPGETVTARAAHEALRGKRRGLRALWPFLGPAFVAAVAYVDPGNFATNISGGAQFGYLLLWVILCSNLMAMLIQSMSAKLGIATGKNLPEVCRDCNGAGCIYTPNSIEEFARCHTGERTQNTPYK